MPGLLYSLINKFWPFLTIYVITPCQAFCAAIKGTLTWDSYHLGHTIFSHRTFTILIFFSGVKKTSFFLLQLQSHIFRPDYVQWYHWIGLSKEIPRCRFLICLNFDLEFLKGVQSFKALISQIYIIANESDSRSRQVFMFSEL